jgi:hypothetical protein
MHIEAQLALETVERLREQTELLRRTYEAEFAKDPTSLATESSRSNLIALRHSIHQVYGDSDSVLPEITDALSSDPVSPESDE